MHTCTQVIMSVLLSPTFISLQVVKMIIEQDLTGVTQREKIYINELTSTISNCFPELPTIKI